MALLSEDKRKEYFKELGLGEYNKTNILKLQKKYMARKTDYDGVYGTDCDNLLRHLKAVKDCCKDFAPEEFRCGCNGRYCCGYPTYMKPIELKNIQSIRSHFGKPMVVTCGLRCTHYNQAVGGITKSEHLYGLATDYYIAGVTDTLANRKNSIKWISKLPNHHYTYGNGFYAETTNGKTRTGSVSAPGMGNAMHTDSRESASGSDNSVKGAVLSDKKEILTVDGIAGPATVAQMQRFFKTKIDGVVSGQTKGLIDKYYPSLKSVEYGSTGSPLVKAIQKWAGVTQGGLFGQATAKAWQKKLKTANYYSGSIDGIFGTGSMKAMQEYLNNDGKDKPKPAPKPTPTPTPSNGKIGQACKDYDHKAGDSSGREVCKSNFKYSTSSTSCYNWTYVFRPKDAAKANKAADMMEKGIANNAIGYSKNGETAYGKDKAMTKLAKAVNYDLSKITTKCGCSCGDIVCLCNHWAGLSTCYIGSGLGLAKSLKKNSNFTCLNYKKGMQLMRGDTIITAHSNGKNNHVAMVL